jgi:hypothetical protein
VDKLASVTLIAVAIVLAAVAPSQGWGAEHGSGGHPGGGTFHHGSGGGHPGAVHDGFRGHGGNLRDGALAGHRGHFHDGFRGRRSGGPLIYGGYPYYGPYAPAYWYYCPSWLAYYPSVPSCPVAWVPVQAW